MNMQDKEIDQLFRSGLDNYEIEPSGHLWGNIATQIDANKKPWKVYLSIAASLLILLTAGLYFVSQIKDVRKKPLQVVIVENNKPAKAIIKPLVASQKAIVPRSEKAIAFNTIKSRKQKVKTVNVLPAQSVDLQLAQQPVKVVQIPADAVTFVVPDKATPFNEKIIPENVPFKASTTPEQQSVTKTMAAAPAKKHRLRNLGDLINVVVSKVDKRKDKLIEFSDTSDEDESVVSGLNLGFIKIKKQDQ
jgi:hypothetical protein